MTNISHFLSDPVKITYRKSFRSTQCLLQVKKRCHTVLHVFHRGNNANAAAKSIKNAYIVCERKCR